MTTNQKGKKEDSVDIITIQNNEVCVCVYVKFNTWNKNIQVEKL